MTVRDLVKQAAIMVGILDPFSDLDAQDSSYGLDKLNQMVDEWATERLAIYRRQRVGPFTVSASTASYTIGATGTWATARPLWIDFAGIVFTGSSPNVELPMQILSVKEWSLINVKTITSTLPRALFYDRQFSSAGLGLIYLYPVPSAASQIVLYVPVAVPEFSSLDDTIALPPGYRMALISNLACLLGLGTVNIPADVREKAITSFGNIKASNVVTNMDEMSCDEAVVARGGTIPFNWITGGIR